MIKNKRKRFKKRINTSKIIANRLFSFQPMPNDWASGIDGGGFGMSLMQSIFKKNKGTK